MDNYNEAANLQEELEAVDASGEEYEGEYNDDYSEFDEVEEESPAAEGEEEEADDGEEYEEEEPSAEPFTQTQAFSRRLNEMSARASAQAVDQFIAARGWRNDFTGEPIRSQAEFEQWQAMMNAHQNGQDPRAAAELMQLREQTRAQQQQLQFLQVQQDDASLSSDPATAQLYAQLRPQVLELMQYCVNRGQPANLRAAFNVIAMRHLPEMQRAAGEAGQKKAVRQMRANSKATPGPLKDTGEDRPIDYDNMSSSDFEKILKNAKEGRLRRS